MTTEQLTDKQERIANLVRKARKAGTRDELSPTAFAKVIGKNHRTVLHWERGLINPSIESLEILGRHLEPQWNRYEVQRYVDTGDVPVKNKGRTIAYDIDHPHILGDSSSVKTGTISLKGILRGIQVLDPETISAVVSATEAYLSRSLSDEQQYDISLVIKLTQKRIAKEGMQPFLERTTLSALELNRYLLNPIWIPAQQGESLAIVLALFAAGLEMDFEYLNSLVRVVD